MTSLRHANPARQQLANTLQCGPIHWSIRTAFIDYQAAAEERRQLAAETGETIRQFINALVAAGRLEEQAREANVHQLAATNHHDTGEEARRWEQP